MYGARISELEYSLQAGLGASESTLSFVKPVFCRHFLTAGAKERHHLIKKTMGNTHCSHGKPFLLGAEALVIADPESMARFASSEIFRC